MNVISRSRCSLQAKCYLQHLGGNGTKQADSTFSPKTRKGTGRGAWDLPGIPAALPVEPTWEKGETLIKNGPPSTEGQSRARGWRRKSQDTLGGRGRRHLDKEREVRIEIILT